jgi:hypothetical protein
MFIYESGSKRIKNRKEEIAFAWKKKEQLKFLLLFSGILFNEARRMKHWLHFLSH